MLLNNQLSSLISNIESILSKLGIMYRIFYRQKTFSSISNKIKNNPQKYGESKKIQDIVGVRIALYFIDDIKIVHEALDNNFKLISKDSQIDKPDKEVFKAIRYNLVYKLPDDVDISYMVDEDYLPYIDNTFELQIRTVLSEGWHEVEHDLRYKCANDWYGLDQQYRALNGIYATLETSDWTLLKLFDELSYTHYKNNNLKAMLNNKLRLRIISTSKDDQILEYVQDNNELLKYFYKFDRNMLFKHLSTRRKIPLTFSNLIYIINLAGLNNQELLDRTPALIKSWWETT